MISDITSDAPAYITKPSVIIPEVKYNQRQFDLSPYYRKLRTVYGLTSNFKDSETASPMFDDESFYFASAKTVKDAIHISTFSSIDMLVDCRTGMLLDRPSPTYSLAANSHLHDILPWSITGQSGSELCAAIIYLSLFTEIQAAAVCVGQRISIIESFSKSEFTRAEAVGSVIFTREPISSSKSFQVLGASIINAANHRVERLREASTAAIKQARINLNQIHWVLPHCLSTDFCKTVRDEFHPAAFLQRPVYKQLNFGSADILVSLSLLEAFDDECFQDIGLVICAGAFGMLGVMVLKGY